MMNHARFGNIRPAACRFAIFVAACVIVALPDPASAQHAGKVDRIGYLQGSPDFASKNVEAFRKGLRDLGYVEGRTITVEWRHTNRRRDRFPEKISELLRLGVKCIVTVGVAATRAAKAATSSVPIVMADADDDPVGAGLIASYARPGGNVTGITSIAAGLSGKRIELLKEIVPNLSRLAVLYNSQVRARGVAGHVRKIEQVARSHGVALRLLGVNLSVAKGDDIRKAFRDAARWNAQALLVVAIGGMEKFQKTVLAQASRARLPVMYTRTSWVRGGGLVGYSANIPAIRRRAAAFVDKVLRGAKPADLPVERATRFELAVNAKTARALGITIPPSILLRADQVIE